MATEVAAGVSIAASVAKAIADVAATKMKIEEGISDYASDIARQKEMRNARLSQMEGAAGRAKGIGIAQINEGSKQAKYETESAMTKAAMASSAETARIGASGVKATGSALMGAQQTTDIAYAAADRTAEAAASGINIAGLQLGNQLQSALGERSLLTLEYKQKIGEQERKKTELEQNKTALLWMAGLGAAAGVASTFYSVTR